MAFGKLDRGETPQPLSEINVTPLVDVMMVLLVIFIVTAPLLARHIKLNLPKADAEVLTIRNPLEISMTKDGSLYLDKEPLTDLELLARLQQVVAGGSQPAVQFRADGEVTYQQVIHIMALVQTAGITKFSFVTDPDSGNMLKLQPGSAEPSP
jgi:biopolymer transport protein TolR